MRTRQLSELTWPEVRQAVHSGTGVVLPVGATEQHGHHLPLATDTMLAADLAAAIAEQVELVVAPPLAYGYRSRPLSGGGQGFCGTTSLSGRTLMAITEDVLRELIRHGFQRMVVLNWHMENQNFVYEAAYLARQPHDAPGPRLMVMEMPFKDLSSSTMDFLFGGEFPGWPAEHASLLETSLMLHLHPELVLFDRAVDDAAARAPWWDCVPAPEDYIAASGTLANATRASAEKGERAWAEIVGLAVAAVGEELPFGKPA